MLDLFTLQKTLAPVHGVSGSETQIAKEIARIAGPYADEMFTDALGNLIVRKKSAGRNGKKIMLSAHMDSIGFVATYIDEQGFVRFGKVGGIEALEVVGASVAFQNGTRGVVACDGKEKLKDAKLENLYIDIGAQDEKDAKNRVRPGDTAAFAAETYRAGKRIVSPYLDNRIGCAALLCALSEIRNPVNELYFVFSAQEEVGTRGAKTAAFGIEPDYALAVDVTATGDTPEVKPKMDCRLGGGAAVKIMDRGIISHPKVVGLLEEAAGQNGIRTQREILEFGGTDAGPIHVSRTGVYTGAVSIPIRHIHMPAEMADLDDAVACVRLVTAFTELKLD